MILPRIFLISFVCGVDKVFWYKSCSRELTDDKEDYFGLWHKDYSPKPAFYAYQTLTQMCPDKSVRPQLSRHNNVYIAYWVRPDKKKVYAIWTENKSEEVLLSIKGKYSCYDVYGKKIVVDDNVVNASSSILYFVGGKGFLISVGS